MSQLARVTEILGELTGGHLTGPIASAVLVVAGMQDEILERLEEVESHVYDTRPHGSRVNTTIIQPSQGGQ
jgi:hypothetical protein